MSQDQKRADSLSAAMARSIADVSFRLRECIKMRGTGKNMKRYPDNHKLPSGNKWRRATLRAGKRLMMAELATEVARLQAELSAAHAKILALEAPRAHRWEGAAIAGRAFRSSPCPAGEGTMEHPCPHVATAARGLTALRKIWPEPPGQINRNADEAWRALAEIAGVTP